MLNPKKKEEGTTTPKTEKATPTTRAAAILATLCTTFQKSYNVWSGFELELFESKSPYCHSLNINNLKPHEKHPADCQCTQRRFLVQLPFFKLVAHTGHAACAGHAVKSHGPMLALASSITQPISEHQVRITMAYAHVLVQSGMYPRFSDNGPAASMDDFNLVLLLHLARNNKIEMSFGDLVERKLESELHYLNQWKQWAQTEHGRKVLEQREGQDCISPLDFTAGDSRNLKPLTCDFCHAYSYLGYVRFYTRDIMNNVQCFRCHLLTNGINPEELLPSEYSFQMNATQEIQNCFKKNGFVVLKGALNETTCQETTEQIVAAGIQLKVVGRDGTFLPPNDEANTTKKKRRLKYFRTGLLDVKAGSATQLRIACKQAEQCLLKSGNLTASENRVSLLRPRNVAASLFDVPPHIDRDQHGSSRYGFDPVRCTHAQY